MSLRALALGVTPLRAAHSAPAAAPFVSASTLTRARSAGSARRHSLAEETRQDNDQDKDTNRFIIRIDTNRFIIRIEYL